MKKIGKSDTKAKCTGELWPKGVSANPKGRPIGSSNKISIKTLTNAINAVEKKKDKSLLEHFVEQAFSDNKVLAVVMKKYIADKREIVAEIKSATIEDVLRELDNKGR